MIKQWLMQWTGWCGQMEIGQHVAFNVFMMVDVRGGMVWVIEGIAMSG